MFTDFPRCRQVMELMGNSVDRNANLLFWGESGTGKTTIIKRYLGEHPPCFDETSGIRETPVIGILMPPVCDPRWLYMNLLHEVGAPQLPTTRAHISLLAQRVVELYRTIKVRQIVIDETHDLMTGTAPQQRVMLNVIRHLTNELAVPLVLFGTEAVRTALIPDPQLARRFRVHKISSWTPGEEFDELIGTILRTFPLHRPSKLTGRALKKLSNYTHGNTGPIK
jgi:type II secretory pathway predicted ATPase ExeA